VPLVSAAAITLVGEYLWRRQAAPHVRTALGIATISAAIVAGLAALAPLAAAAYNAIHTARTGLTPDWPLAATNELEQWGGREPAWELAAIAATAALAIVAALLNKTLTVSLPIALWGLALAVLGAVPLLGRLDAVVS